MILAAVLSVCIVLNIGIGVVNLWNLRRIRRLEAELRRLRDRYYARLTARLPSRIGRDLDAD